MRHTHILLAALCLATTSALADSAPILERARVANQRVEMRKTPGLMFDGDDVVIYRRSGRRVMGDAMFTARVASGALYYFSSAENLAEFNRDQVRYAMPESRRTTRR